MTLVQFNNKNILKIIIINAFLCFVFFPYISIFPNNTDLQPYALLASLTYNFLYLRKIKLVLLLLLVCPVASLIYIFLSDYSFVSIRGFATYFSLFSISATSYSLFKSRESKNLVIGYLKAATYIWMTIALIEKFIDPAIMKNFIPNISLDNDRGVVGLATEPSFYGIYCFFMACLNWLINNNNRRILLLLLFQIIFLAQSTMTIILIVIAFGYWILFHIRMKNILMLSFFSFMFSAIYILVLPQISDLRISYLLTSLINNPLQLIQQDVSLNARFSHIYFSLLGFFDNYGAPHGFGNFGQYVSEKIQEINYIWLGIITQEMKIMSGYGSALFELGLFSISIPLAIYIIFNQFFLSKKMGLFVFISFSTIMFASIQLSLPILSLVLGCMLGNSRNSMPSDIHR